MEPDDYDRWGRCWRAAVRGAGVAAVVVLAFAVAYLLAWFAAGAALP